eukprot:GFKZ01008344.1.p1 GENE.GFKZ01008344.1~~GFKZ01008344.1.p1  ORF type:complete len:518 (-),score=59.61 GFKZ01008344.1:285-1838(-)
MSTPVLFPAFLLLISLLLIPSNSQPPPSFSDVTAASGIVQTRPSLKFGGPCIADVDNDGYYDLILSHHNNYPVQLYFGSANGTFTHFPNFRTSVFDIHGIAVAQRTARSRDRLISVSVGGGSGNNLRPPEVYLMSPSREITDISSRHGLGQESSRGRVTLFMNLALKRNYVRRRHHGGPDALFVNFLGNPARGLKQFAYENVRGEYALRQVPVFEDQVTGRAEVTDIDGDGVMEVISTRNMRVYKLVDGFSFAEVTSQVLPYRIEQLSATAVVEIDYDNDGDFDLYVTRADRSLTTYFGRSEGAEGDILFENVNGTFVDVSSRAQIPQNSNSMGVTCGDFNNDGFVDIMVIMYREPDVMLLNQGNGTFRAVSGLIEKENNTVGNNAVAVDYNLDGRVDLVVGQGSHSGAVQGYFKLLKNTMPLGGRNNYLLVTVANDPTRASTSLHAVVRVVIGRTTLTRRVGSRGAQAGGGSYLDTVHFGLGSARRVTRVKVRWSTGIQQRQLNVRANQRIFFGVV